MDNFLKSRKPIVLEQVETNHGDKKSNESFIALLDSRKPIILKEVDSTIDDSNIRRGGPYNIVAPLNTDLRWSTILPLHNSKYLTFERYNGDEEITEEEIIKVDDSDVNASSDEIIIPPLNTDIRFSQVLPKHDPYLEMNPAFVSAHPHKLHVHEQTDENFSWNIITSDDSPEIIAKKKLINPIQSQHMCGSCWAMSMAACIGDCLVVSGAVNWMPKIAPTYLMMVIPQNRGNGQCEGGNPAAAALALESIPVSDTSCIDYSWCTNDTELCTSASAANHFKSSFGARLNANIPKPAKGLGGACYYSLEKYVYQIDEGSDVFFINQDAPTETFREMVKAHIIDFGPTIAGYAVLKNFVTGNFTNPEINQGIYFDRASYTDIRPGNALKFSDYNTSASQLEGLHAVRVLGWGLAKNVQYDNDKYGDVPYWVAANSWNSEWGNMNGTFRMAMYPFNKYAQFDAQISVRGSPIGGMILIRCTKPPEIINQKKIAKKYLESIKKIQPDSYYRATPEIKSDEDKSFNGGERDISPVISSSENSSNVWIYVVIGTIIIGVIFFTLLRR